MNGGGGYYGDGDYEGAPALRLAAPLTSTGKRAMDSEAILRKQGDTLPVVEEVLRDGDGIAVNLSDATAVLFIMKNIATGAVKVEGACEIVDALGGEVLYRPQAADFDTVGVYRVEFQITFADGTILTVPTDGYRKAKIVAQLK